MRALFEISGGASERLLIMLPAAKARPEGFFEHGFVEAVRRLAVPLDVCAVDAHSEYYLEGDIVARLEAEIIEPMSARGYRELWLAGISLGGMGCVAYACEQARALAGVFLLAPFLGLRGGDRQPQHLVALQRRRAAGRTLPAMFLGYGRQDRYAAASAQLAQLLPVGHTVTIDGGHDWPTWKELWNLLLTAAFPR